MMAQIALRSLASGTSLRDCISSSHAIAACQIPSERSQAVNGLTLKNDRELEMEDDSRSGPGCFDKLESCDMVFQDTDSGRIP